MENSPALVKAKDVSFEVGKISRDLKKITSVLLMHALVCVTAIPPSAYSYSVPTHRTITTEVTKNIKANRDDNARLDFRKQYGISFTENYPDSPSQPMAQWRRPAAWVIYGAGTEDDGIRSLNHFYNPFWNSTSDYRYPRDIQNEIEGGLFETTPGDLLVGLFLIPGFQLTAFAGLASSLLPQWIGGSAMEWIVKGSTPAATNALAQFLQVGSTIRDILGENEFSWFKAREYFLKALTEQDETVRTRYVGKTFHTLGHAVHHLQDAAQPAHVRNDMHFDDFMHGVLGVRDAKFTEAWTARHIGEIIAEFPGVTGIDSRRLVDDGNPATQEFPSIKDFFDVRRGEGGSGTSFDQSKSRGIAEFTNYNFYSEDTVSQIAGNVNGGTQTMFWRKFENPWVTTSFGHLVIPGIQTGKRAFRLGALVDPLPLAAGLPSPQITTPSPLLVVSGLFHTKVVPFGRGDFTMKIEGSDTLMRERARRLIPKALAYSAGAIDFFFRGKLDIKPEFILPPGTTDGGTFNLHVKNLSGEPLGPGKVTVYREDAQHQRFPVAGYEDINVPAPVGDQQEITALPQFILPSGLDASNGFMLVYRGKLGGEVADEAAGNVGAVIGQKFHLLRVNNEWGLNDESAPESTQDLYMRAPDGSIISWYNQVTDFGRRDPDYTGTFQNGPDHITVKELSVPGDYTFLINDYQDLRTERVFDYEDNRCESSITGEPMSSCPPEDPIPDGIYAPDPPSEDPTSCYCATRIHNTVRTYFNSVTPTRLQIRTPPDPPPDPPIPSVEIKDIYTRHPTYNGSNGPVQTAINTGGDAEGMVDDSWWIVQKLCVEDDGDIFIGGVNGVPGNVHYVPPTQTQPGHCEPTSQPPQLMQAGLAVISSSSHSKNETSSNTIRISSSSVSSLPPADPNGPQGDIEARRRLQESLASPLLK